MRKPLVISMLFLFLFGTLVPVKFQEALWAMSELVAHYEEHLEETPDLSVVEFWRLHYGDEYNYHKKDHDHSKLPGKDHGCCHVHSTILAMLVQGYFSADVPNYFSGKLHPVDEEALPAPHLHNIWQPPKSC